MKNKFHFGWFNSRTINAIVGIRMKHLCALLAGCCLLGSSYSALAYESRGARSCAGWQEYRIEGQSGYPQNAGIYETWVIGYISGIVAGSGTDFLAGTDTETVYLMVDAYCDANIRMNLAAAGTHVSRQLVQQKGIAHMPTLP